MHFLFDTYKQHHDQGLTAHQAGDTAQARLHYLLAAKYLCALAKDGDGAYQEQRLRKAVLLLLAGIYTVLGLLWGGAYLALGFPLLFD